MSKQGLFKRVLTLSHFAQFGAINTFTSWVNVWIDPNWAKWLKVIKRLKKPGFEIHHLPEIDIVMVTHAHFDHLDRRTLRKVAADQPIIVPTGVGNLVHDLGFQIVHELDCWQSVKLGPMRVSLTPCYHWGARFLADLHRGFGGFVIEVEGRTIFHCGDSAFFPGFREIGQHYKIDIALLPIGAYDAPTGREVHMNPEEAMRAFIELKAKTLVPMHYGTFRLGYEPLEEPLERLGRDGPGRDQPATHGTPHLALQRVATGRAGGSALSGGQPRQRIVPLTAGRAF